MSDTYKTIKKKSEGIYKEKGSKFLSFAFPVEHSDEINLILKEYRKQFYDAHHICYAYMLGQKRDEWRTNDDGEPSGTAGKPILGQINSFELTNILVVVVRYFGGILLGTGGLTTAYKESAANAIQQAQIVEMTVNKKLSLKFDYLLMNDVMRVIKEMSPQIIEQKFDNTCAMQLEIRQNEVEKLHSKFEKIMGVIVENE